MWLLPATLATALLTTSLAALLIGLRRHARRLLRASHAAHRFAAAPRPGAVAVLCHEIRTPMQAVIGILELLSHRSGLHAEVRHYLDTAHHCARSLTRLLGDVLDLARLEAGRLDVRPEPIDLPALMRDTVDAFRPLALARQLDILLQIGALRARRHCADPQRVRQILGNLLSNAIKFGRQGRIAVGLCTQGAAGDGETVRITVRDHGAGIAAGDMARLFEPFFRSGAGAEAREAATDGSPGRTSGAGLGLAISRQLARQMAGDLVLTSRPGDGTEATLTLTLPMADAVALLAPADRHGDGHADAAQPGSAFVLIVEDHPVSRLLLAQQLRHLGIDSAAAAEGWEALARCGATRRPFDLIIADCNMPGMDGFTLARALREQERQRLEPRRTLIGYSADDRPEQRARALAAGMDDWLVKPVTLNTLGRTVAFWLGRRREPAPTDGGPRLAPGRRHAPTGAGDADIRALWQAANAADRDALQRALDAGDLAACQRVAHRIKGAAMLASADQVAERAAALEAACERSAVGDPPPALEALRAAMQALFAAMARSGGMPAT